MAPWYDRNRQFSWLKTLVLAGTVLPGLWIAIAWSLGSYDGGGALSLGTPSLGGPSLAGPSLGSSALGAPSLGAPPLGAMPITEALHQIGLWTVRFLLLTLAVTPFRRIGQWPRLILVRRMLGVTACAYAVIHLTLYVVQQHYRLFFVASEIALRFYLTIGFVALLGFIALAATSTDGAMRRLGGKAWQRLHYLVYPIGVLALAHFFLQAKVNVTEPVLMSGFFLWLMGYRLLYRALGNTTLTAWHLLALAIGAGLLTALGEAAWYQFATGIGGQRILFANLSFAHHIRPCWWVLLAGLGVVLLKLSADRFWSTRKRPRLRPATSTTG